MLLLAGCNGSTKGCREPYRERKGILGISWRIESFKLIFPKYDDCRNPGIIAEDDWKLFLFDGVKNAGAELDYDLIEPQLPADRSAYRNTNSSPATSLPCASITSAPSRASAIA